MSESGPTQRGRKRASNQSPLPSTLRADRQNRPGRTLTCTNCRTRKTKCDGTQPGCKTCEVYKAECRYEKPPPMSQILAMAKRLQEYEQRFEALKRSNHLLEAFERGQTSQTESETHVPTPLTSSDQGSDANQNLSNVAFNNVYPETGSTGGMHGIEGILSDLSLDEDGKLCYYGPTSAVHDPLLIESHGPIGQQHHNSTSKRDMRTMLTSSALESRAWEDFSLGNAAIQSDIPRETMSTLLKLHWAWIAPMFMWVYRPAFMRDMSTGGQYFSQFLLTVLCAHSARFQDGRIGDVLISRARLLLGSEIHKPSSIPTVQALLQLSARDLAFGSISQSWLYSGLAFRMVSDLGLHHSSGKILDLGYLTAEDLEIRRRLFWSCYFWDKAISLYLGRMPALTELPLDHAPELLDDFAEDELWTPYYGESPSPDGLLTNYPPMKSHAISCFENSCKLAVILNDILLQLYSRRALSNVEGALKSIRAKLDNWRENSPPHLKYDPEYLPEICGPPHILTQNLLYYTTLILLHRPFYPSPVHHAICRQAAENMENLLQCLEKTFGFSQITYLMAYCIYTGASVMVQDIKTGDMVAASKMSTFLRALEGGRKTCPVVQRSLDIINNGLQSPLPAQQQSTVENTGAIVMNYLPAFPHHDPQVGLINQSNFGTVDMEAFSLLDCYPENHINTEMNEWFMNS